MANRAKCKKCNAIVESFTDYDYVECKCGEIAVEGIGLRCFAKDWSSFARIDEMGNEIIPKIKERTEEQKEAQNQSALSKGEKINMLKEMIKSYENLPRHVMDTPISHSDFVSALLLISSILDSE